MTSDKNSTLNGVVKLKAGIQSAWQIRCVHVCQFCSCTEHDIVECIFSMSYCAKALFSPSQPTQFNLWINPTRQRWSTSVNAGWQQLGLCQLLIARLNWS